MHASLTYNITGITHVSNKWLYTEKLKLVLTLYLVIRDDKARPTDLENMESRESILNVYLVPCLNIYTTGPNQEYDHLF